MGWVTLAAQKDYLYRAVRAVMIALSLFVVKNMYFDGSEREIVDNNSYAYGSGHELVDNNSYSYGSGHEVVDNNNDSYGSGHEFVDNNNDSYGSEYEFVDNNTDSYGSPQNVFYGLFRVWGDPRGQKRIFPSSGSRGHDGPEGFLSLKMIILMARGAK